MAPIRTVAMMRRRSSLSMMSKRRRSLVAPKNFTFAPNVTPVTYPSDPNSPTQSPNPDGTQDDAIDGEMSPITPTPAAPRRRRNGRRDSVEHIPRPPNAFMLFRQNFVHQRHVPGSIETNHHSLSKIVGNCWKALPASDKKHWEELAEKKKDEHKKMYPDYRFQPKHDPEKKRKRQAARLAAEKAERERLEKIHREQRGITEESESSIEVQEKEQAMATRRAQVRAVHNHLCHRRSSSVPLPTETYGYPYNSYGTSYADPFNFANPAIANGPHPVTSATSGNGIAIPSLPTNFNGVANPWYPQNTNTNESASGSRRNSLGASGTDGAGLAPNAPNLHAPQPMSLSRAPSPRFSFSGLNNMFGGFGAVGMNTFGMGTRAARQHQLGQLGRRASSTQPILQHQMASGAFGNYAFGAVAPSSFPQSALLDNGPQGRGAFDFGTQQMHESLTGPDGFIGAVAEGFTNPFASAAGPSDDGSATAPQTANTPFPAPLAPNAMWYEVDSVDPMTPVGAASNTSPTSYQQAHGSHLPQQQLPVLPEVDASLLNPAYNFSNASNAGPLTSDAERAPSPTSASVAPVSHVSAPQSAVASNFGVFGHHHHAPHLSEGSAQGTGARDSFDFSAFNAIFAEQQQPQQPAQEQSQHPLAHAERTHIYTNAAANVPAGVGFHIAQPVPVRKVGLPDVPEGGVAPASAGGYYNNATAVAYPGSQPSSESSASGSPASARVDVPVEQQQQQHYAHTYPLGQGQSQVQHSSEGVVTGLELLEGPVDVSVVGPDGQYHSSATGYTHDQGGYAVDPQAQAHQQQSLHGYGSDMMYSMPQGMDAYGGYSTYAPADAGNGGAAGMHQNSGVGAQDGSGAESRFSFSDYIHGSPFTNSAAVVN